MILDLEKFIQQETPHWESLEKNLESLESGGRLDLDAAQRFMLDYERAAADLIQLKTFTAEPTLRRRLESLVARAYAELHETRDASRRFSFKAMLYWMTHTFPQAFRRHFIGFQVSLGTTLLGAVFGALALLFDPGSRSVTMAFGHDQQTPSERVAMEEASRGTRLSGSEGTFSAQLMYNNIRVSITALALGMTFGIGTLIALFYNGVILGAIAADYIQDGQGEFLAGWILPHGSIELPAIIIAGQAGLMLGHALLGRGSSLTLAERLRVLTPDLVTLIAGVALMLVWAGIVEGTLSQWHEPVLPYVVKIAFGLAELGALIAYLGWSGKREPSTSVAKAELSGTLTR